MKKISLTSSNKYRALIDITPMLDLVFLMVIFFMVTSSLGRLSSINVVLPKAQQSADTVSGREVISINKANEIFINDEKISKDKIVDVVKAFKKDSRVVIRGDKESNYDVAIGIIDLLNTEGIKNFELAAAKSQ